MSSLKTIEPIREQCFDHFLVLPAVDLLSLSTALEQFDTHGLRAQNDKLIDIPDMVTVLTSIYEHIAAENPTQVSVPLCIDLAINWLLNVYDRYLHFLSNYQKKSVVFILKTSTFFFVFVFFITQSTNWPNPSSVLQGGTGFAVQGTLGGKVQM